jgi:hypothetical protein
VEVQALLGKEAPGALRRGVAQLIPAQAAEAQVLLAETLTQQIMTAAQAERVQRLLSLARQSPMPEAAEAVRTSFVRAQLKDRAARGVEAQAV